MLMSGWQGLGSFDPTPPPGVSCRAHIRPQQVVILNTPGAMVVAVNEPGDRASDIEAVLFDFGGVITTSPFDKFATYEADNGLPKDLIRQINSTNPDTNAWAQLERSHVDQAEFCRLFEAEAAALGHSVDGQAVLACLSTDIRPEMVAAVEQLRGRYKTAVLTNNIKRGDSAGVDIGSGHNAGVMANFDAVIESAVVGVRKPDPAFYDIACTELDVAPTNCVFLDDLGINLKPARALGMATIKVTSGEQALTDLEAVLGISLR